MNDNLGNMKRYMEKKDSIHSYSYKNKYEMNIIFDLFLDLFASKIVYYGFLLFKKMLAASIWADWAE